MKKTEQFLREHWHATRRIGRLMMDLSLARSAYLECCKGLESFGGVQTVRTKKKERRSPVEHSAIILVDQHRAELESIEKRLRQARATAAAVEYVVMNAGLDVREKEYIRLRYFENRAAESVAQRMFCSTATCRRIRGRAIEKIEAACARTNGE